MIRILFVDDEPSVCRSLQRLVRAHDIPAETESASSAELALRRIEKGGIDVVVSDLHMPGMNGLELLKSLKANPETWTIPVIMLTGSAQSKVKGEALEEGAVEFLTKPADPAELCARLRNVMSLKAYQDELAAQNDILAAQIVEAQKMEIAGLLASQAAHDLNNILGAVIGNAELALIKTSDGGAESGLKRVIQATEHAIRIVRQIRDLGRKQSEPDQACNPCEVIEETLDLIQVLVPPDVTIDWTNPNLSMQTPIEATSLSQVIMNLAINAVHAMKEGGRLKLRITERHFESEPIGEGGSVSGHFVGLTIADTGSGIDAEILPHIFEPFYTTKKKGKGTGIGLSVVNRVVTGRGGFIEVESLVGEGTTFTVNLPVIGESEAAAGSPAAAEVKN